MTTYSPAHASELDRVMNAYISLPRKSSGQ
jgi:hypothetical protein